MHSSRMRTADSLPYRGCQFRGEALFRGQRPPSPVNRMTDTSKNIILPQTSYAGANYAQDVGLSEHETRQLKDLCTNLQCLRFQNKFATFLSSGIRNKTKSTGISTFKCTNSYTKLHSEIRFNILDTIAQRYLSSIRAKNIIVSYRIHGHAYVVIGSMLTVLHQQFIKFLLNLA